MKGKSPGNLRVGTQTIGPKYRFTEENPLLETAKGILEMGSDVLKFSLAPAAYGMEPRPGVSLREMADLEPFRTVLDMPFRTFMFWAQPAYSFGQGPVLENDGEGLRREMYDLTRWLLQTFSGTGKTFLIGNWEGDWLLLGSYDGQVDASAERLAAARDYYRIRQEAVAEARREVAHENVWVGHYIEVNRPLDAKDHGRKRLANEVLPRVAVDLISYSAYDALRPDRLAEALDYVEAQARFTSYFDGHYERKVFIGEYDAYADYHVSGYASPEQQVVNTWAVIQAAIEWGAPFVLFWEFYNNESERLIHGGGFWLIDQHNVRQPVWHLHHEILASARTWREGYRARHQREPDNAAWRIFLHDWRSSTSLTLTPTPLCPCEPS